MAMKTYFVNNQTYGADDLNTVLSRLTTQGVSLYNDTGSTLADLNTSLSGWIDSGVDMYDMNSCRVVSVGNGNFKISKGCCWMPSGACAIFDNDGYIFEPDFTNLTKAYVYLRQGGDDTSGATNEINVIFNSEKWVEGSDMPLAVVYPSGAVTDSRVFAKAKIGVPTTNIVQTFSVKFSIESGADSVYCEKEIVLPFSGYSYILYPHNFAGYSEDNRLFAYKLADEYGSEKIAAAYKFLVYAKRVGESLWLKANGTPGYSQTFDFIVF